MVVQAGGARRILDRDPARAVEAAAHIEEVGRAAMAEMRRLLGVHAPRATSAPRSRPCASSSGWWTARAPPGCRSP